MLLQTTINEYACAYNLNIIFVGVWGKKAEVRDEFVILFLNFVIIISRRSAYTESEVCCQLCLNCLDAKNGKKKNGSRI